MKYNFYFNNNYFKIYNSLFPDARSRQEAKFLSRFIPNKNSRVLDLGCAWGRHLKTLVKMGYEDLTGVDYAEELLAKARKTLDAHTVKLMHSDFAKFHSDKPFDFIFQTFQAFGHEDTAYDRENIKNVYSNLNTDGKYLLDLRNPVKLLKGEKFDLPSGIKIVPKVLQNGNRFRYTYFINNNQEVIECNIYTLIQLTNMFKEAGLEVIETYGNYDGQFYSAESERLILVGRKS